MKHAFSSHPAMSALCRDGDKSGLRGAAGLRKDNYGP